MRFPSLITEIGIFSCLWSSSASEASGYFLPGPCLLQALGSLYPGGWSHPRRKCALSFLSEQETAPLQSFPCPCLPLALLPSGLIFVAWPHLTPCLPGFSFCSPIPTLTTSPQSPRPLLPGPGSSLLTLALPCLSWPDWSDSQVPTTTYSPTVRKRSPQPMVSLRTLLCSTICPVR